MSDFSLDISYPLDWSTAEFNDDKPIPLLPTTQSPASIISSDSSSSYNSPNCFSVADCTSITDSDSDSDSDIEPLCIPKTFRVLNDVAYDTDILPVQDQIDAPYIPPPPLAIEPFVLQQDVHIPPLGSQLKRKLSHSSTFSDEDADGESHNNESDDEYIPSPPLKPHKRRTTAPIQFDGATIFPALAFPSPSSAPSQHPVKRSRPSPPSRNVQATASSSSLDTTSQSNPWACPHCSWVQRNKRTPDLKRHIRTHTRLSKPAQWVCCGVPLEESASYQIHNESELRWHEGKYFIGGCGKEFSRRDALKRHLDNYNIRCAGNPSAFVNDD